MYASPRPNRLISRKKGPARRPDPGHPGRPFHAPQLTAVAMPKTEMSRFPIHDDLTAPEASLPILKGASSAPGSSRTSSASWPARPRPCARTCASEPSCGTAAAARDAPSGSASRWPSTTAPSPASSCTRGRPARPGSASTRSRAPARWDSGDAARGRAAALPAAAAVRPRRRAPAPAGGGARGRLGGRAAPGGHRGPVPGILHGDGQPRRRDPRGRLRGGDAGAARRLMQTMGPRAGTADASTATAQRALLLSRATTRRSSWSASAGRARSSTCCCRAARCASPRSPRPSRTSRDRLLSERMKELEARGIVERHVSDGTPARSGTS